MPKKGKKPKPQKPKEKQLKGKGKRKPDPDEPSGVHGVKRFKPRKPKLPKPHTLETWLDLHPTIRDSILWDGGKGEWHGFYSQWPTERKQELHDAYSAAWKGEPTGLVDPPPLVVAKADDEACDTIISADHAWRLYVAYVAHALALETEEALPWSLMDLSSDDRNLLLRSLFLVAPPFQSPGHFEFSFIQGCAVPAPPDVTFKFFKTHGLLGGTMQETIVRLIGWCHENLIHFVGSWTAKNMEDQWQYRGFPPVSRMLSGTAWTGDPENAPDSEVRHRTAGCHGTLGFLRAMLRAVNIAGDYDHACDIPPSMGHALVKFVTPDMYLSHADDPYGQGTIAIPPIPPEAFLIDGTKYQAWFGAGIPDDVRCSNVGRRRLELQIEYLPTFLLKTYCKDLSENLSHADGSVYAGFKPHYSVEQLETEFHLWERMDEKIAELGGCGALP